MGEVSTAFIVPAPNPRNNPPALRMLLQEMQSVAQGGNAVPDQGESTDAYAMQVKKPQITFAAAEEQVLHSTSSNPNSQSDELDIGAQERIVLFPQPVQIEPHGNPWICCIIDTPDLETITYPL